MMEAQREEEGIADLDGYVKLKEALRPFIQEVCEGISRVDVPDRLWTRIVREGEGRVAFPQEKRRDFTRLIFHLLAALHTSPTETLQHAVDIVCSDPQLAGTLLLGGAGKPITGEHEQQWWATNLLAGAFLRAYFSHGTEPGFDTSAFDVAFHKFKADLESPGVTVTELSPLLNCRLDGDRLDVAPGLVIRKLSTGEVEQWLNADMEGLPFMGTHVAPYDIVGLDCAMEVTYYKEGRHEAWGSSQEVADMVSNLLSTLRLITDRNVHLAFTKRSSDSVLHPGGGTSSTMRPRRLGLEAHLTTSIRQEIVETWSRIRRLPTSSAIRLALRRWDIVSERFDEDDALIDYWIALESLFVPGSAQEVTYRASLRIAAFVGETPEERLQAYKDLRNSYGLRSRVVHGGAPESEQKSNLVSKTRSYLRRALLKVLFADEPFHPEAIESLLLSK